jgi:hypothetical protein
MANLFDKMAPSGKGDEFIVVSGALWDMMVERINALCDAVVTPDSNVGMFNVSKSGLKLDLASVDSRLQALESTTGIVTYTNSSPPSLAGGVTIIDLIETLTARLDSATATANCVANTVVITFTI